MTTTTATPAQEVAGATWDANNPAMHLGTQRFTTSDEDLAFLARNGVQNMALNTMPVDRQIGWDVEWLGGVKEKCAGHGIELEMVALPVQQLNEEGSVPNYMRGDWAAGEQEIEIVCKMVRAAGEAGLAAAAGARHRGRARRRQRQ